MLSTMLSPLLMGGSLSSLWRHLPNSLRLEDYPIFNYIVPAVTLLGTIWALWNRGFAFIECIIVNACIISNDLLYDDLILWMKNHGSFTCFDARGESQSDLLFPGTIGRRAQHQRDVLAAQYGFYAHNDNPFPPARRTSGYGVHLAPTKGSCFVWFQNTLIRLQLAPYGTADARCITIHCLTRSEDFLRSFLEDVRKYSKRQATSYVSVHRVTACRDVPRWSRVTSRPARDISTVILDKDKKEAIIKDIKEYLHPRTCQWYSNHGIPYRRGYLLSGPPGTGKSSLAGAIAGMFDLDIYVLGLNDSDLTEGQLHGLFSKVPPNSVVLVEDVDVAGVDMSRGQQTKTPRIRRPRWDMQQSDAPPTPGFQDQPISLSGLLNVIDGVASQEGRILILTTNVPESLDRALIRPGRVDLHVRFTLPRREEFRALFQSMYSGLEKFEEKECPDRDIEGMGLRFANQLPDNRFSVAEVQGYLLQFKLDPEEACLGIAEWVKQQDQDADQDALNGHHDAHQSDLKGQDFNLDSRHREINGSLRRAASFTMI